MKGEGGKGSRDPGVCLYPEGDGKPQSEFENTLQQMLERREEKRREGQLSEWPGVSHQQWGWSRKWAVERDSTVWGGLGGLRGGQAVSRFWAVC